jgi:hypothetical protein
MYQRRQRRQSKLAEAYQSPSSTTSKGLDVSGISAGKSKSEKEQLAAARKAEDLSQQGDWWKQGLSVGGGILGGTIGAIGGALGGGAAGTAVAPVAGTAAGGFAGGLAGATSGYALGSQLGGGIGDMVKSGYDKEAARQTDEMEYKQMRQQALLAALRGLI